VALLLPWEFSPTVLATIAISCALYLIGSARTSPRVSSSRRIAFFSGVALVYCALQTSWDYYASHMFFVHRLQHFVLHDVAPALIAASAPAGVLRNGLPAWIRRRPGKETGRLGAAGRVVFDPWTATAMYIASLVIWIWPPAHFDVMLSNWLYKVMNWSVVIGDLPFWFLVLDPTPYPLARLKGWGRLVMLFIVMLPMMISGAVLSLSRHDLYPVYAICGRFAPVSPLTDQRLGGLIIWIPGTLLILIVMLIVLGRLLRQEHAARTAAPQVAHIDSAPAI
jgi:putative membrane protein